MSTVILTNRSFDTNTFENQCGISSSNLCSAYQSDIDSVSAKTPYLVGNGSAAEIARLKQLSQPQVAKNLTDLSLNFGGDNVAALAEISARLSNEYNVGLIGASTTFYAHRIGGFAGAVKDYQAALIALRDAKLAKSSNVGILKKRAYNAFHVLQSKFGAELRAVNTKIKANKGTPLTNPERAINIASSSRNIAKLDVTSQIQTKNLVKFSQHAKLLGNGLAMIDLTSRAGNVYTSYQTGGKWERDLFIESFSFAMSAGVGLGAVKAGSAALTLMMVATPVGWVGFLIGGAVVIGTAAAASIAMNDAVKSNSGDWYDLMMGKLGIQ